MITLKGPYLSALRTNPPKNSWQGWDSPPPTWQCQDFGNIWYTNPSLITWEKLGQVDGLQDLLRPKLLTWRNRLCKRLWSSEDPRFCYKMQGKWWTVQVLHQEGCRLLPWVQVSDLNKTEKRFVTSLAKVLLYIIPLHLPCTFHAFLGRKC